MNIKIMLNKDEEITKLAQDPEVQIRIKNAIVDEVARRTVKAVGAELEPFICDKVRELLFSNPKAVFDRTLRPEVKAEMETYISASITSKIRDVADGMSDKFDKEMSDMLELYKKSFAKFDVEKLVSSAAERFIKDRLSGRS